MTVLEPGTGHCWARTSPGRIFATYHPKAPPGLSYCKVCSRAVVRGMGRWWTGERMAWKATTR